MVWAQKYHGQAGCLPDKISKNIVGWASVPALQIALYKIFLTNLKKALGKTPKAFLVDMRSLATNYSAFPSLAVDFLQDLYHVRSALASRGGRV
ncbi:MAG TPA: hypothetical protein DCZ55_24455 [Cyanobacteria bacterium UBA11371]|nr:hypothetical protein [Cyanobacteria bacterium UBA11371]